MRAALAFAVVVGALAVATGASASTWTWGFNYLGNSSNNGLCPSGISEPGAVCSPWNYWASSFLDKTGGGGICFGWANNGYSSCYLIEGGVLWTITPSELGMGGYIKSEDNWEYDNASYLQIYDRT